MKTHPHNVKTIKNENRALILGQIRKAPTSRADIAKRTGMSKSAVTMITGDLMNEGQIIEIGEGSSPHGRKSILLDIVPTYRYAAGIALHRKYIYVCITDLKSNILSYSNHRITNWNDPKSLLDFAYDEILRFLSELNIPREKCIGIGVSAPGPLDYEKGVILNPPDFPMFRDFAVSEYLQKKSGMPVLLDNNAVLLCMQEYMNSSAEYKNSMFVVISDGIGSAVMYNGHIFRGSRGFAGELGHISIHADGIKCDCGNCGCLEKYVSISALQEKFGFSSYEKLVDDAYMGDKVSCEILAYIAGEFSAALASAVNLFDLDAIIIYGQFSYRSDKLCTLLRKELSRRSVITQTHSVALTFSDMSPDKASASVCSLVINRYFEQKL